MPARHDRQAPSPAVQASAAARAYAVVVLPREMFFRHGAPRVMSISPRAQRPQFRHGRKFW